MLRSWHGLRAHPVRRQWKGLDVILSTSTEPQFFIDRPHESPFNVGITLPLEDFLPAQVEQLNALHPSPLGRRDIERLYALVQGHPYLTRKALYMVASRAPTCGIDELFAHATEDTGPFGDHLRYYLLRLQGKPELISALRQTIDHRGSATSSSSIGSRRLASSDASRTKLCHGASCTPGTSASVSMPLAEAFVFVAGGTVQAGDGVYLERDADREVLEHCRAGRLHLHPDVAPDGKIEPDDPHRGTSREATERSRSSSISPSSAPRRRLSNGTRGFLFAVQDQLGLRIDSSAWWNAQPDHSFAHRFTRYLREVALVERARAHRRCSSTKSTRRSASTSPTISSLRSDSCIRTAPPTPNLARLSFVLIGVATPGDLIKDGARTPFNIGQRVELTDFTVDEAVPLTEYLRCSAIARARSHRVDSGVDRRASVPHASRRPIPGRVVHRRTGPATP